MSAGACTRNTRMVRGTVVRGYYYYKRLRNERTRRTEAPPWEMGGGEAGEPQIQRDAA